MQVSSGLPTFSPVVRFNPVQQTPVTTAPDAPVDSSTKVSAPVGAQDAAPAARGLEDSEKLLSHLRSRRVHHDRHHQGEMDDKQIAKTLKKTLKPIIKELKHQAKHLRRELGPGTEEGRAVKDLYKDLRTSTRDAIRSARDSGLEGLKGAAADIQTAFETFAAGLQDIVATAGGGAGTQVEAEAVLAYDVTPTAGLPSVSSPPAQAEPAPVTSTDRSVPVVSLAEAIEIKTEQPAIEPAIESGVPDSVDEVADSVDEDDGPFQIEQLMAAFEAILSDGLATLLKQIAAIEAEPPQQRFGHHFGHGGHEDTDASTAYSLTDPVVGGELDQAA